MQSHDLPVQKKKMIMLQSFTGIAALFLQTVMQTVVSIVPVVGHLSLRSCVAAILFSELLKTFSGMTFN